MSPLLRAERSLAYDPRAALLALTLAATLVSPATAQQALEPQMSPPEIAEALRAGGYVLLIRHGATTGQVDADGIDFADCATQRDLSELGERQSREMGDAIRSLEIPIGEVLSSP